MEKYITGGSSILRENLVNSFSRSLEEQSIDSLVGREKRETKRSFLEP